MDRIMWLTAQDPEFLSFLKDDKKTPWFICRMNVGINKAEKGVLGLVLWHRRQNCHL